MSISVSIDEAQANLPELIGKLSLGEDVVITNSHGPIARLTPIGERKLGTMRGTVKYMAPDFDAPLDDFQDYSS